MGLIFPSRRRRGPGLMGMALIVGGVVVATPWMLRHSGTILTSCQNTAQSIGVGAGLCNGMTEMLASVNNLAGRVGVMGEDVQVDVAGAWGNQVDAWKQQLGTSQLKQRWDAIAYRLDAGQAWGGGNPLSAYVKSDVVEDILKHGARVSGGGSRGQLESSMGYFAAGQKQMGVDPVDAIKLYKKGARMGEFGILSQLKLGSHYMGQGSMADVDLGQASQYNAQALSSLQKLEMDSSPEAQATLSGLPLEPTQLRIQLQDLQRRLQQQMQ